MGEQLTDMCTLCAPTPQVGILPMISDLFHSHFVLMNIVNDSNDPTTSAISSWHGE